MVVVEGGSVVVLGLQRTTESGLAHYYVVLRAHEEEISTLIAIWTSFFPSLDVQRAPI